MSEISKQEVELAVSMAKRAIDELDNQDFWSFEDPDHVELVLRAVIFLSEENQALKKGNV